MKTIIFVLSITLAGYVLAVEPPVKQPSSRGVTRAKSMKQAVRHFGLHLNFKGDSDKPYYSLVLSVDGGGPPADHYYQARITAGQAEKIIDHLLADGFFDRAVEVESFRVRKKPTYTLSVHIDDNGDTDDLGWGLPMLKRLDGLRKLMDGDAAKKMDLLLGRLAGHRKEWESKEVKVKAAGAEPRVASQSQAEVDQLKQWLGFASSDSMADIQEKVKEDMEQYGASFPNRMRTYRGLLQSQRQAMEDIRKERDTLKTQLQHFQARFAASEAGKSEQIKRFTDAVERQHQGTAGESPHIALGLTPLNTRSAGGYYITWVNKAKGMVGISFEKAGELAIKARFDVYDVSSPRQPTAGTPPKTAGMRKSKGCVEVTRILGARDAEATIVKDDQNSPIAAGDELQAVERSSAKGRP